MSKLMVRGAIVLLLVLTVVGCDQATKIEARRTLPATGVHYLVGNYLVMVYAENRGGFLSLGARWPVVVRQLLFVVVSLSILAALIVFVLRRPGLRLSSSIALALIAGGGMSNLISRIVYGGRVVDFLNLGIGSLRTGIFNLADVAILAGVGVMVISLATKSTAGRE